MALGEAWDLAMLLPAWSGLLQAASDSPIKAKIYSGLKEMVLGLSAFISAVLSKMEKQFPRARFRLK